MLARACRKEPWFAALERPTGAVPSAAAHNNALAWRTETGAHVGVAVGDTTRGIRPAAHRPGGEHERWLGLCEEHSLLVRPVVAPYHVDQPISEQMLIESCAAIASLPDLSSLSLVTTPRPRHARSLPAARLADRTLGKIGRKRHRSSSGPVTPGGSNPEPAD